MNAVRESVEERAARFRAEQLEQVRKGALENPMQVPRVRRMLVTDVGEYPAQVEAMERERGLR